MYVSCDGAPNEIYLIYIIQAGNGIFKYIPTWNHLDVIMVLYIKSKKIVFWLMKLILNKLWATVQGYDFLIEKIDNNNNWWTSYVNNNGSNINNG
jgi:hypothetical protein